MNILLLHDDEVVRYGLKDWLISDYKEIKNVFITNSIEEVMIVLAEQQIDAFVIGFKTITTEILTFLYALSIPLVITMPDQQTSPPSSLASRKIVYRPLSYRSFAEMIYQAIIS